MPNYNNAAIGHDILVRSSLCCMHIQVRVCEMRWALFGVSRQGWLYLYRFTMSPLDIRKVSGKGGLYFECSVYAICRYWICSELTVKPLMVTGNVAEKRRICRSVGRNEINLSSACWQSIDSSLSAWEGKNEGRRKGGGSREGDQEEEREGQRRKRIARTKTKNKIKNEEDAKMGKEGETE